MNYSTVLKKSARTMDNQKIIRQNNTLHLKAYFHCIKFNLSSIFLNSIQKKRKDKSNIKYTMLLSDKFLLTNVQQE